MMTDQRIQDHFDRMAPERPRWQARNAYYYEDQKRFFRFLVPKGLRVLEVGCGLGDLLAAVEPARGVGLDVSPRMVEEARKRHPSLEFVAADARAASLSETFDVILLSDVVGYLTDVEETFKNLRRLCHAKTRVIVSFYNFLWEPLLGAGETFRLRMPQPRQNWLSMGDLRNLLHLAGFEAVKTQRRLLLPVYVPLLSSFFNKYVAQLPFLNWFCLSYTIVARPLLPRPPEEKSVSVVVPCRNEKGNIEALVKRLPKFGSAREILFVEGGSSDGTPEELERVRAASPGTDIRIFTQEGRGKADAVRKGFAEAKGDVLMILDADLTVPPEDLPRFYEALVGGKGEFINGSRLVYPMEKQAMRFLNLMGNKFFSLAFSWILSQRIKDTLCGTKVLLREDYRAIEAGRSYFGNFDPFGDFDLLFGASKLNLKILEVPVRYGERRYGTTNIQRFRHGWLLLKMTVFAFFKLRVV